MSGSPQESGMSADRWLAKAFGDVSVDGDARASRESRGGRARDETRDSFARYEPAPARAPGTASKPSYWAHGQGVEASHGEVASPKRFFNKANERLYEAYSQLHTMAQEFDKPFDAPAILVVGHQTDGKSALVEALMGFQFNHVGGGTKTRRPIAINMKYNPTAVEPRCFLIKDDNLGREEELSLPELQAHIEDENRRLENENGFWAKDIVVKIEYKYCPNLTIIDTPGLISAAPGRKFSGLQQASRLVEDLVRNKMQQRDYIILCLEDCSDWSNATTRRLVLEADPELRRTVMVSTKFDTRIPQFSRSQDVEMFMHPPARLLAPSVLGSGPFFSSVPSGRVGLARDSQYRSNDHYREAVLEREQKDIAELERRLDRHLTVQERGRVGVSQLRFFLERLLQQRYLENVPTIVPVLEREHRIATSKLSETVEELNDLNQDHLKEKGRAFYQHFLEKIPEIIRGTLAAPPRIFGETLAHEHIRGGAFVNADGRPCVSPHSTPNGDMRLFGGAQYHRALEEFRIIVNAVECPPVSREDIVNSCGVDELHNGVNYTRTACVIAIARAKETFEPFVHQLGFRLSHIARRLLPVAMYLLQKEGRILNGHEVFLKKIGATFARFVDDKVKECQDKCHEDLKSTTQFVTWSLHSGNKAGLRNVLSPTDNEEALDERKGRELVKSDKELKNCKLTELVENTLWNRSMKPVTVDIVDMLVRQIFAGIRSHIVQSIELKFNCFFLMPLLNDFNSFLRNEMEDAFEISLDSVFDVKSVRNALEARRHKLETELAQMEHIQDKFTSIHTQLEASNGSSPATQAAAKAAVAGTTFHSAAAREMAAQDEILRASHDLSEGIAEAKANFSQYSPRNLRGSKTYEASPGRSAVGRSRDRAPLSPMFGN